VGELGAGQPTAAGWYADPSMPGNGRWYDGAAWTNHTYVVPVAPAQPGAPDTGEQVRRATTTVVRLMVGFIGAVFAIGGALGLVSHSTTSDLIGAVVALIIGVGLLIVATRVVAAPPRDAARRLG
jgi:Protein of unknown function (DUF2510)